MSDDWHLDCPKPEVWDKLEPSEQREWIEAVMTISKITKIPVSKVATRNCDWAWHPLDREVNDG